MSLLTPLNVLRFNVEPALFLLREGSGIPTTDEARVLVLAIAGQESNWEARLQYGGPARSLWQFEQGGGVTGVYNHPASSGPIAAFCDALGIPCDIPTLYEAMAWNGPLGAAMARLLLYTDAAPLPELGKVDQAWEYYLRNWRPGMPHPETWPQRYQEAMGTVNGQPAPVVKTGPVPPSPVPKPPTA